MNQRFYHPGALEIGSLIELSGEELHHARVTRIRPGENVEVFDGRGRNVLAVFEDQRLRIESAVADDRESPIEIALAIALIQPEKFELVLQKATELGVASFLPLVTARTEVRVERVLGKRERWEKIVLEAVKQCGRSRIPTIAEPIPFEEALEGPGLKILFDADSQESASAAAVRQATVFIGPEGGWSEEETAKARELGCTFQNLGPRRLRAETAAIAACVILAAPHP
ncbi:MAG TPA: RsmE family RNA methyltransferase [Thermoanaerobaculia bacterium]